MVVLEEKIKNAFGCLEGPSEGRVPDVLDDVRRSLIWLLSELTADKIG